MKELDMGQFTNGIESRQLRKALNAFQEAAVDPLHRAFLTRTLHAIAELANRLNDDLLGEATSLGSDIEVLASALSAAPDLPLDETDSAWLKAKLRGVEAKRKLLESDGGTASSSQLAELLDITRQAVDKKRKNDQLLAVQTGGRSYRYPVWQVVGGETLFGLQEVLGELSDEDPWMTLQFFLRENPRLDGKRPLDVLRKKSDEGLKAVLAAARTYGEHGAD